MEQALDPATIAMIERGQVLTLVFMGNTSHSTGAIASEDARFFSKHSLNTFPEDKI